MTDEQIIYQIFMSYQKPKTIEDYDHAILDCIHFVARNFADYKLNELTETFNHLTKRKS